MGGPIRRSSYPPLSWGGGGGGQPSFIAPLTTSIVPLRAVGSYSFTRATTATVQDWEACIKNVLSGEARFKGARRVHNLLTVGGLNSEDLTGWAGTATAQAAQLAYNGINLSKLTGTGFGSVRNVPSLGAFAGKSVRVSFYAAAGTGTGIALIFRTTDFGGAFTSTTAFSGWTSSVGRYCTAVLTVPASDAGTNSALYFSFAGTETIFVGGVVVENVTGQSNQNPSEYVSNGIKASPYHGASVDGVKYFSTQNAVVADQNLLLQSQTFQTTWTPSETTVSVNTTAAPDSTVTADSLFETVANANHYIEQDCTVSTINAPYTLSIYAKPNGRTTGQLEFDDGTNGASVDYDLAAGTISGPNNIGAGFSGQAASITSAGNGWYRITLTATIGATAVLRIFNFIGSGIYAGDITKGLILWGAQLQPGLTAGTYVPTTAAAVIANTVTESTSAGPLAGPAISSSALLGYYAEEQRTNLVLQSSNFGVTWAAVATPTRVAANDTLGGITLDLIGDNDGAALEGYTQTVTFTGNATKSVSLFVKKGTSTSSVVRLRDTTAGADRLLLAITWVGTVPTVTYTTGSQERPSIAYANGIYRIHALTTSVTAANTNSLQIYPATTAALAVAGTGTISVGGVQAEDAVFATSHIPTTTAIATRNGDVLKYPIAGNVAEATGGAYSEVSSNAIGSAQAISAGSETIASNRQINRLGSATQVSVFDGVNTAAANIGAVLSNVVVKIASTWSGAATLKVVSGAVNAAGPAYNGDMFFTDTNFVVGGFNGTGTSCTVRNLRMWKRLLSDGEMAAMTT